jgi:hypothetical protein
VIEPRWETATEEEVWKFVAWHLAKNGIQTILVGGAVAAIYSDGIYKSGDLDFVLKTYSADVIPKVMASIGFKQSVGRHYILRRIVFVIDWPRIFILKAFYSIV